MPGVIVGAEVGLLRTLLRLLSENAEPVEFEAVAREAAALGIPRLDEDVARAAGVSEQLLHHKKRERELLALYDTARDITALRNTDELLRAIVHRARHLVGGDIAYVSSLEGDTDHFIVRATEGSVSTDFELMKIPRGYGLCGQVAELRRPCHSAHYSVDHGFERHPQIDRIVQVEGIVSLLGVPLEIKDHVIGVLFVGDRFVRSYTPQEIAILSSLAALAALAIHNSRLYADTRRALDGSQAVNQQLNAKAAEIRAAGEAHERMIDLVAHGGSLQDLSILLSERLCGRVCIVDERARTLCLTGQVRPGDNTPDSNGDPDPEAPGWRSLIHDTLGKSVARGRSVAVTGPGGIVCRIAAIFGGSDLFGGLLIWRQDDLSEADAWTLERGAIVSAIVLLSNERLANAATRDAYDVVSSLLREPDERFPSYTALVGSNGAVLRWPLTLFLVELAGRRAAQLLPAVRQAVGRRGGIQSEYNGDLVVLLSAGDPQEEALALQEAIEGETGIRVNVAVSEPAASAAQMPACYRLARRTLRMLRTLGHQGRIAHERVFAVYAPLFHGREADEIALFLDRAIGPLRRYDEKRGTELAATLLAYLDNGMRLQRTAEFLGIHINTMRQRLNTIGGICRDWDDPSRLLEVHLALKLHVLSNHPAP